MPTSVMLNAYFDLRRRAWIACAIIHGQWIEGASFATWDEADQASRFLKTDAPERQRPGLTGQAPA